MKTKINWKLFALLFIVCAGIYFLTRSFWMSLGILLLLFVIDGLLADYDRKRRGERNKEQVLRHLHEQKKDDDKQPENQQ